MPVLGDRVLDLCAGATGTFLLVAPFIKDHALARIIHALPAPVELTCVTRWAAEEVVAGVSDLEVFDRLAARPKSRLLLLPTLHAKLFRTGARCLVGSANVTGRALGWASPPNSELLAEVPADHPDVVAFVRDALAAAAPATAAIRDEVRIAVRSLPEGAPAPSDLAEDPSAPPPQTWLPRCSRPDQLWDVYASTPEVWKVLASNVEAARADLAALGVPPRLGREMFVVHVASHIRAMPLVAEIDRRTVTGISDTDAVGLIRDVAAETDDGMAAEDAWAVLKEWLGHFLAGSYRRTAQGEVLIRGRELRV